MNNESKPAKALRYLGGATLVLIEVLKRTVKKLWSHIHLIGIVLCIVGMVSAVNAFDVGNINYITSVLFVLILAVLMFTIIKIMILEEKK